MNIVRSYKRALCHRRMELDGFRQVDKHGKNMAHVRHGRGKTRNSNSYFANHWREYLRNEKRPSGVLPEMPAVN